MEAVLKLSLGNSKSTLFCAILFTFRGFFFSFQSKTKPKRVKAIYNCVADNPDELTFSEGDIIVVDGEEDQEWWVSILHFLSKHFERKKLNLRG